ncbi:MAG TPA: MBL fold metallo-hydrolase, partial [Burkholderiaceae bacterium]|nr:MBL fold metallo-hydrolase [Burkholderiaceae bacterium]
TGDYVEDSVKPVFEAGLADIVDAHHVIDQHIRLVPSHGHTPGHVCVEIASQGQSAVIIGDLLHHPLQCRFPHWSTRFCFDADQSRQTRLRLMQQYAHDQTLVFPAHFPAPTAGRLQSVNAQDAYFDYLFVSPDHVITDA